MLYCNVIPGWNTSAPLRFCAIATPIVPVMANGFSSAMLSGKSPIPFPK